LSFEVDVCLAYLYISVENVLVKTLVEPVVFDFHNDFLSSLNHIRTIALSEAGVKNFLYMAPHFFQVISTELSTVNLVQDHAHLFADSALHLIPLL